MNRKNAFTLIELLVVIAIIALLLAIIMPGLRMAKEQARRLVCASHLRGVGLAISAYLEDNDSTFHNAANNGMWEDHITHEPFPYNHGRAYWGIAYSLYTDDRKIFHCPSARIIDCWILPGEQFDGQPFEQVLPYFQYCHYGLNGYTCYDVSDSRKRRITDFKIPSNIIFAQDHIEQTLDDAASDMFCIGPGSRINLTQWRGYAQYPNGVQECFRHNRTSYETGKGRANNVWMDGHVSVIQQTDGEDIPIRWYTGNVADPTKSRWNQ